MKRKRLMSTWSGRKENVPDTIIFITENRFAMWIFRNYPQWMSSAFTQSQNLLRLKMTFFLRRPLSQPLKNARVERGGQQQGIPHSFRLTLGLPFRASVSSFHPSQRPEKHRRQLALCETARMHKDIRCTYQKVSVPRFLLWETETAKKWQTYVRSHA